VDTFERLDESGIENSETLSNFLAESLDKQRDAINAYFHNAGKGAFEAFLAAMEKEANARDIGMALKFQKEEQEDEDPALAYAMQKYRETAEFQLSLNESLYQQGLIGEQEYQDRLTEITRKAEQERFEIKQEKIREYQQLTDFAANFVLSLMELELEQAGDNEEKKAKIRKKYANIQFLVTSSQIIANTAGAIMKALADLGPIAGAIAATIIGATGAVQLGIANAERKKAQAYAKGKYPIESTDGKTYNAKYAGQPKTGIYEGPHLGVFSEVPNQPEMVVDGVTTRELRLNYPQILEAIYAVRDGMVPRFARGKYPDNSGSSVAVVENNLKSGTNASGVSNSEIQELLRQNLTMMKKLEQKKLIVYTELIKKDLDTLNDIETKRGL